MVTLKHGLTRRGKIKFSGVEIVHILVHLWGYTDVCIYHNSLKLWYVHYTIYELYLTKERTNVFAYTPIHTHRKERWILVLFLYFPLMNPDTKRMCLLYNRYPANIQWIKWYVWKILNNEKEAINNSCLWRSA